MKRFIYLTLCVITCAFLVTACGKDSSTGKDSDADNQSSATVAQKDADEAKESSDNTETTADQELQEVPVSDALPEEDETEAPAKDSSLTEPQENVAENPTEEFHGSGTFNGFIDSSSIEVTMADGSYQTFFVYDDTVYNKLMNLSENDTEVTIQFTYKAREGQVNPEIIAIN